MEGILLSTLGVSVCFSWRWWCCRWTGEARLQILEVKWLGLGAGLGVCCRGEESEMVAWRLPQKSWGTWGLTLHLWCTDKFFFLGDLGVLWCNLRDLLRVTEPSSERSYSLSYFWLSGLRVKLEWQRICGKPHIISGIMDIPIAPTHEMTWCCHPCQGLFGSDCQGLRERNNFIPGHFLWCIIYYLELLSTLGFPLKGFGCCWPLWWAEGAKKLKAVVEWDVHRGAFKSFSIFWGI